MEPPVITFFLTYILKIFLCCLGTRWIAHKHHALEVVTDIYGIYMQHIADLAEDNNYPQKDCNKFRHWYQKWTSDLILILFSLAIKILSPA